MKFKVGDKVRMLPSAVDIGVFKGEVGKTGTVTDNNFLHRYISVCMDEPYSKKIFTWAVRSTQITSVIKVGQQLEFVFMKEGQYE